MPEVRYKRAGEIRRHYDKVEEAARKEVDQILHLLGRNLPPKLQADIAQFVVEPVSGDQDMAILDMRDFEEKLRFLGFDTPYSSESNLLERESNNAHFEAVRKLSNIKSGIGLHIGIVESNFVRPAQRSTRAQLTQIGSIDIILPAVVCLAGIVCAVLSISGVEPWYVEAPIVLPPNRGIPGLI